MLMRVMGYDYGVYKKQYDSNAQACKALNSLAFSNGDNIDLFNLLEILLGRDLSRNEAREKAIQYSEEHGTDKTVVMTIAGATNSKIDYSAFEKEMAGCVHCLKRLHYSLLRVRCLQMLIMKKNWKQCGRKSENGKSDRN